MMSLHEWILSMQGAWYEPAAAFLVLLLAGYGIGFPILRKLGGSRSDAESACWRWSWEWICWRLFSDSGIMR